MSTQSYDRLVQKMKDVSEVRPQTLGPLTPLYRIITPFFKRGSWRPLLFSSVFVSVFLYIVLGASIVWVVSILQHGF